MYTTNWGHTKHGESFELAATAAQQNKGTTCVETLQVMVQAMVQAMAQAFKLWFKLCRMVKFVGRSNAVNGTTSCERTSPQNCYIAPAAGPPRKAPMTAAGSSAHVRKDRIKSTVPSTAAGSSASVQEILGTVAETPSAHRRRHQDGDDRCSRCTLYKFAEKWKQNTTPVLVASETTAVRWHLSVRLLCVQPGGSILQRRPMSQQQRLKTKWSVYEVRGHLQAERIREHARTEQHRRALKLLQNPSNDAGSMEPLAEQSDSEAELFAKSVPQLKDWVAAWSACTDDHSWVCAAKKRAIV